MHGRTTSLIFYVRAIQAQVPVALFLERSPELATAALAVLKAGGAYVPLDPTSPTTRLAMLLEDSAVPPVLTQTRYCGTNACGKVADDCAR